MSVNNQIIRLIIDNKPGALAEVTNILGSAFINIEDIEAISFGDRGVIRIQTEDDDRALRILQDHGYHTAQDEVILIALSHDAGALAKAMELLAQHNINVHSARVMDKTEDTVCVMLTTDNKEKTREVLKDYLL